MKLRFILFAAFFGLIICNSGFSQVIVDSKAVVSNIDFNLVNEEFIITYDILNSRPGELFLVTVNIKTESGKPVSAKSFKGDVGEKITGGLRKTIIWEISKDIAFLDDKISVEIEATLLNPKILKPVSKGTAILLSTIYPGWGSSKITLKNYHLVKGAVSYGTLAGSFIYKKKSDQSFLSYQNAGVRDLNGDGTITESERLSSIASRDGYFKSAQDQKLASRIMLYASAAIWVADYVTIIISENRSQKKGFKSNIVYLGPSIGLPSNSGGITMICNF